MSEYVSFDTNVLIDDPECINEFENVIISIVVVEELDKLKNDKDVGYYARKALKNINKKTNIKFDCDNQNYFMEDNNDNKIITCARNNKCKLYSNDLAVRIKASTARVDVHPWENTKCDVYKGYKTFSGTAEDINKLFADLENGINTLDLIQNEYVMFTNTDTKDTCECRFDNGTLVDIKLPPSKVIKGLNGQQRCALDLLLNKDIPIKIIAGTFGSGKTMLAVKMGMYHVVGKENYRSIMFLRNPIAADQTDIGFLPGDKNEKIKDYCKPFFQYIENESQVNTVESLMIQGKIQVDVVSFLKGVNIDDTYVICDEAEDLNTKLIKLVGSRIGKKACIVFTGDWKQCESKYKNDNGLLKLIDSCKGNDLVGIVVLDEDVRSAASKVFAELK
jgi:PhoH-like ATPase